MGRMSYRRDEPASRRSHSWSPSPATHWSSRCCSPPWWAWASQVRQPKRVREPPTRGRSPRSARERACSRVDTRSGRGLARSPWRRTFAPPRGVGSSASTLSRSPMGWRVWSSAGQRSSAASRTPTPKIGSASTTWSRPRTHMPNAPERRGCFDGSFMRPIGYGWQPRRSSSRCAYPTVRVEPRHQVSLSREGPAILEERKPPRPCPTVILTARGVGTRSLLACARVRARESGGRSGPTNGADYHAETSLGVLRGRMRRGPGLLCATELTRCRQVDPPALVD